MWWYEVGLRRAGAGGLMMMTFGQGVYNRNLRRRGFIIFAVFTCALYRRLPPFSRYNYTDIPFI